MELGSGVINPNLASVLYVGIDVLTPCPACGGTCTAPAGKVGQTCALDVHSDSAFNADFLSCNSNADCATLGTTAGNCTMTSTEECFLNPITATGVADPNAPVGVAAFCIPETSNAGINSVAGLPGPGRIKNAAGASTFCASNNAVQYTPGVGGCP